MQISFTSRRSFQRPSHDSLKQMLLPCSLFNLFLVAVAGLLLRAFPLFSLGFDYKFMVHGHSHFAFGGWLMPAIQWILLQYFRQASGKISASHWRNIIFGNLVAAYGMLLSFPFQGYGPVSIAFSTLSIVAGFYMCILLLKATTGQKKELPVRFLRAGLFYFMLSSLGAFATGPLMAMGYKSTALYFDAIYFYLHFQYNGFFLFTILAVFYQLCEHSSQANGRLVFRLMNGACIPAYLLSVLWSNPGRVFNVVGGLAALAQLLALFYFARDWRLTEWNSRFERNIAGISMAAFSMKIILQLASAFPAVANMAYSYRNLVIAYLHLVLLGCISMFIFALIGRQQASFSSKSFKWGVVLFIAGFTITELLLGMQGLGSYAGIAFPGFEEMIFVSSILLPLGAGWMFYSQLRRSAVHISSTANLTDPSFQISG